MKVSTIGADPEAFVMQNGKIISAIGLIGGTKENPRPMGDGFVQEDNVLAEFNIKPCEDEALFIYRIQTQIRDLQAFLRVNKRKLSFAPHHTFELEYLKSQGHKALELGCSPDLNAYTIKENPPPRGGETGLRTASGHIHVGIKDYAGNVQQALNLVQAMDIYLGLPSITMDSDRLRRTLYGKAGACRLKDYGVEYRTLSNFWLVNGQHISWAYNQTHKAAEMAGFLPDLHSTVPAEEIQRIINEYDQPAALKAMKVLGVKS